MRVLESWLQQYIKYRFTPDQLVEKLTMLGLEFESVEHLGERYRGFVVGQVVLCSKHPNADRLTVCMVNTGKETQQIVCGAPNVAAGQKVAVGLAGATVPRNQHDPAGAPFVLTQTKIRGVESNGMICSAYELGLGDDAEGIMVLDSRAKPGTPLARYLGMEDIAYDIEITPNRPDWLSHIGVAREIGVLTGKQARLPRVRLKESATRATRFLSVRVDVPDDCPRFAARMIRGVTVGPSPDWLQNALRNVGLRPRNNIVDITNYVMYECGQPLHAFDHALLEGGSIVVRRAAPGTRFTTLDGKERTLPDDAVMVCDALREVSIAGVMGGANSEINDATRDVVIESAYWNPSSIRRTSKALGLSTDASQRFERGADVNNVPYALDRAAELMARLAGGTVLKGAIDVYPKKIKERKIWLRPARVNAVLGTDITRAEIVRLLRLLNIRQVRSKADGVEFIVPTYRIDVDREIDLIEEVARIHGYDRIGEKTSAVIDFGRRREGEPVVDRMRLHLVGAGFHEAVTNSMEDEWRTTLLGETPVRLLNPLNKEMANLRTSLVPGLLDVVARNLSFGNSSLRLFEIGHVFRVGKPGEGTFVQDFVEHQRIGLLLTGTVEPPHWSRKAREVDIFDMKGVAEGLLKMLGLDKVRYISYRNDNGVTHDTLNVEVDGRGAGWLGEVEQGILQKLDIGQRVYVAEFTVPALHEAGVRKYTPLPRFPKVTRDMAFLLDAGIPARDVEEVIIRAGSELLQGVELFDVYEGDGVPEGKKSLAYSVDLMSTEKTLEDAEINAEIQRLVEAVERAFGATLRSVK